MTRDYASPVRDRIVELLTREGRLTAAEIADHLELPRASVDKALSYARRQYGSEVFRIAGYRRQVGNKGRAAALFAAGPGKDAPRPRLDTKPARRVLAKRFREKHAALLRARDRKRRGVVGNHFLDILGVKLTEVRR